MISLKERSLMLSSKRKCKKIISRQHYSCVTELTERKLINEKYKMILKRQEKLFKVLRKFGFYSKSNRKPLTSLKQKELYNRSDTEFFKLLSLMWERTVVRIRAETHIGQKAGKCTGICNRMVTMEMNKNRFEKFER